jgi:transcriptional regulator with XRE-family HTH domain
MDPAVPPAPDFAAAVRAVRRRSGMSQKAAAARLGLSPAHLCNVENGVSQPSLRLLDRVRAAFGVCPVAVAVALSGRPLPDPAEYRS